TVMVADPLAPTLAPLTAAALVIAVLGLGLIYLIGRGTGPGPADTAVAYEHAWDRLDFATLWNLSGPNLRDGRTRDQFVRDKVAAYRYEAHGLAGLVQSVHPETVDVNGPVARVLARLDLHSGESVVDEMLLERIGPAWHVTAYHISTGDPRTGIGPAK
ncbi:MAG TPA: hypothetical protein VFW57_07120, partial [Acidimicrobiia bacterium]|nr:hypothetical protein [Acidimicrobiia bacterium]